MVAWVSTETKGVQPPGAVVTGSYELPHAVPRTKLRTFVRSVPALSHCYLPSPEGVTFVSAPKGQGLGTDKQNLNAGSHCSS